MVESTKKQFLKVQYLLKSNVVAVTCLENLNINHLKTCWKDIFYSILFEAHIPFSWIIKIKYDSQKENEALHTIFIETINYATKKKIQQLLERHLNKE